MQPLTTIIYSESGEAAIQSAQAEIHRNNAKKLLRFKKQIEAHIASYQYACGKTIVKIEIRDGFSAANTANDAINKLTFITE
jgi:hypothetical protein